MDSCDADHPVKLKETTMFECRKSCPSSMPYVNGTDESDSSVTSVCIAKCPFSIYEEDENGQKTCVSEDSLNCAGSDCEPDCNKWIERQNSQYQCYSSCLSEGRYATPITVVTDKGQNLEGYRCISLVACDSSYYIYTDDSD